MPSSKPGSPTTSGSGLSQAQVARARSYSYRLFSQLYLQGITAVTHPIIQQIPELTVVCPQPFAPDLAAASYHELFQFNVFAQESFFLSDNGLVGSEITAVVRQYISQRGYPLTLVDDAADQLGQELGFLAFLAAAEADAWEAALADEAKGRQTEQMEFMQAHLLRWMPACLLAIQKQAEPFFNELAQLTMALVLAHFDALAKTLLAKTAVSLPPPFLAPPQDILAENRTGFKEIVRHLITPAFSGIYLSRYSIGQLARQLELPRGFGNREMMLLNLLRTAVQYDALPPLLNALQNICRAWKTSYQQLAEDYPQADPFLHPWQARAAATEQMVIELMASSSIVE